MSLEELRSFCRVPDYTNLELSDGPTLSNVGEANNAQEQFVAELCFPISLLVKKFLHVTRAPLALIHPNIFQILMGYIVLNFLYQLDISLVEIFFIYTLNLGIKGRLSMSAHSPRLKFVTRLPDSSKTEEKRVILVRGLWYETPDYVGLPFDVNQSLVFPGLS